MAEQPADPEEEVSPQDYIPIKVKVSHYNPALGGVNCARFVNGECVSKMSSGERWQDWWEKGVIACPFELPFWTQIKIGDQVYTCLDRGGAIVYDGNSYWVDILGTSAPYPYGTIVDAWIVKMGE